MNLGPLKFRELLELGNFANYTNRFDDEYDDQWVAKGDRVRGHLLVISVGILTSRKEIESTLQSLNGAYKRDYQLQFGNAYELAYFGGSRWNGWDYILALGSSFGGRVPALCQKVGSGDDQGELYLDDGDGPWLEAKFLCVESLRS